MEGGTIIQYSRIIAINEIIREVKDRNKYSCGIFLDFQKAFDTVNHKVLIGKLNHYGMRELSLDWFKSYQTNRQQKTSKEGIFSDSLTVSYDVPQGYTLGSIISLIHINDPNDAIAHSLMHHFPRKSLKPVTI